MRMRQPLLLAIFSILIISSCRKDEHMVPAQPQQTVQPKAKKSAKPFSGSLTTSPSTTVNLSCNCGTLIDLGTSTGSGNFTHMGNTSVVLKPCVSFTPTGFYVGAQCGTLTAANGDDLYTAISPYNLNFNPATMTMEGVLHVDFAGGTGRFSDASGGFDATLSVDLANNGTLTVTSGTISY